MAYTACSENGYDLVIEDDADLLTDSEETALIEDMRPILQYGNAAFISTDINYSSVSSFAEKKLRSLFGYESSTVFVIDMDNREIYIYSDGRIYKVITTAYANTITDNVYKYATNADYYTCASKAFGHMTTLLDGGRISQPMKYISNALIALTLGLIINFIVIKVKSKSAKASEKELLDTVFTKCEINDPQKIFLHQTKVYDPPSSSSGGGGGGHHGGGGHSGGGGGHSF